MELILIVVFFTPNEAEKNNGMHTYAEVKIYLAMLAEIFYTALNFQR